MKYRILVAALLAVGSFSLSGCANGVKATDFKRFEVGEFARAETGTLVTQQRVILSSWLPFGLGPGGGSRASGDNKVSMQKRGVTYLVKLDRTGETIAITQADDVYIANGAAVWIQFGDRVRVFPKQ